MEINWNNDNSMLKDELDEDGEGDCNDPEGVWSADIEQSFREALAIYPPCGRRKIILSDEGKMYGRNELIARYIKLRTGKTRTRKQVSSHIQVLARRKTKEVQNTIKDPGSKEKALHSLSQLSSAQIVSASALHAPSQHAHDEQVQLLSRAASYGNAPLSTGMAGGAAAATFWPHAQSAAASAGQLPGPGGAAWSLSVDSASSSAASWHEQCIASHTLRLIELTAYVESTRGNLAAYNGGGSEDRELIATGTALKLGNTTCSTHSHVFAHISPHSPYAADSLLETVDISQIIDKFPDKKDGGLRDLYERGPSGAFFLVKFWADINTTLAENATYGVTTVFEGNANHSIRCSTKVCSFGKQVVEKIDKDVNPQFENGKFVFRVERSPMCEYMINFITKLRQLPEKYMMNSVLENFTILQLVTNQETQETLLCICYAFEVSSSEHGAQHHIYKLVAN